MKPIFLIGYMGSGKTTLGRAVAEASSVTFVDLDEYVEDRHGMTVKQIFAAKGESGFREAERTALHELAGRHDTIIACGGGTPCFFDNISYMNSHGVTVYLDCSLDTLHRRLCLMKSGRPLIAALDDAGILDFIVKSMADRSPYYSQALHSFSSDRLETPADIAASVEEFRKRFMSTSH